MTGRGNWRIKDDTGLFNSNLCALYGSMHPPGDRSGCTVGHSVQSCRIFWSHCFCYCLFKLYLWSNCCCSICLCTHLILSGAHVHVIVLAWKFYFHSLVWPAGCWYLVALRLCAHLVMQGAAAGNIRCINVLYDLCCWDKTERWSFAWTFGAIKLYIIAAFFPPRELHYFYLFFIL